MRLDIKSAKETHKKNRLQSVSEIIVDVNGITFNGDEVSQDRMCRALAVLEDRETILWTCADNIKRQVTKEHLRRALKLAVTRQSELW